MLLDHARKNGPLMAPSTVSGAMNPRSQCAEKVVVCHDRKASFSTIVCTSGNGRSVRVMLVWPMFHR